MKKYIFAALALLAIACAKEDVEQQPAPQPITINVADFPTTRADSYGKTAWEAGDKLMVDIRGYKDTKYGLAVNERSLHTLTYNGTKWSIDTPIGDLTEYGEYYDIYATYCPNMQMEWNDIDAYFLTKTTDDQNPYLSEYLCDLSCSFDSGTNTLDILFDEAIARNNRIRVNYKPNTEIKISLHRVDYVISFNWLAREYNDEDYEDVEFNVTTDNDGNAFIYAMWHGYTIDPEEFKFKSNPTITIKSSNGSKTLKTANLPYTEGCYWAHEMDDDDTTPEDERAGGRAFVLTVPQE